MIRSRTLLAAALAAGVAGLACTKANSTPAGIRFRQPTAIAVFRGLTLQDASEVKPYTAVANASRNDVSLLDGITDLPLASPIKLRTLVLAVEDRPSLLAAASLGDVDLDGRPKPDLLVAVSGGDSVLQVVETWSPANAVHSEPPLAVDLGYDVVALAAMPPDPDAPGVARIAAALADRRVAVVEYARDPGDGVSITLASATVSAQLPFQPEAIAAMPDDPDVAGLQTALYVATRDEIAPGLFGVAELSADLSTVRALGARAPTRLVAAARLQERKAGSAASDASAFDGQPRVPRVYAVLDESGCGITRPIDCGIVTLDPALAGGQAIPPDYAGLMPYRAPIRVRVRAVQIAASGPPALQAAHVEGEPDFPAGFMRIYMGKIPRATTGVAAVAGEDGFVYFLDLGRFERITTQPIVQIKAPGTPSSDYTNDKRLWIQLPDGTFAGDGAEASPYVTVTPGFTGDEIWTVAYQGLLSSTELVARAGEAGELAPGQPWLALQLGDGPGGGPRILNEIVRLWHPRLGVRAGDILVIKAKGMPAGCVGTDPPGTPATADPTTVEKEFEVRIAALLAPTAAYPGGAVSLVPPSTVPPPGGPGDPQAWVDCYGALAGAATGTTVWTGLTVTVRAQELVMAGTLSGYGGRPELGVPYALQYPTDQDEDVLAALCPLADWDGSFPPADPNVLTCGGTCDRAVCEKLVLARKARRQANVSVDCTTNPDDTPCADRWPGNTFPIANGPVVAFQVGVQTRRSATTDPARDLNVKLSPSSGIFPLAARGTSTAPYQASGIVAFDRTPWTDPVAGYRFLVSYPADFVLDTTPSQTPLPSVVVR